MKRVVSVSLGSSKRNKQSRITILGEEFLIERIGVDGDLRAFERTFQELDGKVDALGVGGADIYLWVDSKRYAFRQIERLVFGAKQTPVVDGSGLKHTLERKMIFFLQEQGIIHFEKEKVLLTMAVDRVGMARALSEVCPRVVYGDLMFGLGLPIRLRSYKTLSILAKIALPIITRLPFRWFYPVGEKQEKRKPKFPWAFHEATVIAGDWHYILRYCPEKLPNKTIITNTLRKADLDWLREAGVCRAITSTPNIEGETFGTNVMEGVIVALIGKRPQDLNAEDYENVLRKLKWQPNIFEFL